MDIENLENDRELQRELTEAEERWHRHLEERMRRDTVQPEGPGAVILPFDVTDHRPPPWWFVATLVVIWTTIVAACVAFWVGIGWAVWRLVTG